MNSLSLRAALLSGVGALLTLTASGSALASPRNDNSWPQAQSDVAPDPDVRFGRLANGMRYAIMHNATPKGQVAVRLRIGSGSFEESDDQQGLAHVLEHMAFKGSTHVPAGEMLKILERKGLAFGPDTNASTEQQQTVYMLDLPEADADTVDTGLMLMRETASELTLDPAALQSERGVVLSEERLRATPSYNASKASVAVLLEGQRATDRWPIGTVEVIQNAPATRLRAFYQANYRPERATLVVVGDIDPAAIEAKIKTRFGDWSGVGAPAAEPDLGAIKSRGLTAKVVVQPGGPTALQIAFVRPFDATPDSAARQKRDQIENVAFAILNRRLEKLARGANPPFLEANASDHNALESTELGTLSVVTAPGKWREGLEAAERVRRQTVELGVRQDEIELELKDLRSGLENAAKAENTRRSPDIAAAFVQSIDEDDVITRPSQDLARFETEVKGLGVDQVNAALRHDFSGQGPVLVQITPTPIEGGDAALKAAFAAVEAKPITAQTADAVKPWPYTNFGPAGAVAEVRKVDDLGVTFVRFANGVRLTVKPTNFSKDEIVVLAKFGRGDLGLPRDRASPTWAVSAMVQGGLKALSLEQIQHALAGTIVNQGVGLADDGLELEGTTRPKDFALQLQLLAADLTQPGFRPEAFERQRAGYLQALDQIEATAQGVASEHIGQLQRSGDPRWHFPTRAELEAAKPADLQAMLQKDLTSGPLEVVIVGDVSVDEAIKQTALTFGALPPRPAEPVDPAARVLTFPAPTPTPVEFHHKGRADQGMAIVSWPTPDTLSDPAEYRRVLLTQEILKLRLIDEVRISQGATYSPATATSGSQAFPGYGFTTAEVEIPPAKMAGFFASASKITADMAHAGVTADEIQRARKPLLETFDKERQSNGYWLGGLTGAAEDPRRLDWIRNAIAQYQAITPEDVRRMAAKYLTDDRAWKMTMTPAAATKP